MNHNVFLSLWTSISKLLKHFAHYGIFSQVHLLHSLYFQSIFLILRYWNFRIEIIFVWKQKLTVLDCQQHLKVITCLQAIAGI
jgi:hypothetical protein